MISSEYYPQFSVMKIDHNCVNGVVKINIYYQMQLHTTISISSPNFKFEPWKRHIYPYEGLQINEACNCNLLPQEPTEFDLLWITPY